MNYLVTGASSGFGLAIAEQLATEGHQVCAVARRAELLEALKARFPEHISIAALDVTDAEALNRFLHTSRTEPWHGVVLNAGGPPVMNALEADIEDWNRAWKGVFTWKAALCKALVPGMIDRAYGRILFIESASIQQPVPGLVLSNAVRAAVFGYARTLSREIAKYGITVNVLMPGSHQTPAIERVIHRRAEEQHITPEQATQQMVAGIPIARMGTAQELASLACWLLSEHAGFITGQGIRHDGGVTG
jgi:3-oxoacyl-[acyl-carrier protein] reductase